MIKDPIVVLERCDKIWETLQLIKTIQKPIGPTDCDKNEKEKRKEEKVQCLDKVELSSPSYIKNQRKKSDNTVPFKFSIQKTRKVYPCITCNKQYLERRSLRKHSERIHGVVLPLLIRRKRWKHIVLKKDKKTVATSIVSVDKKSNNSEKLHVDNIDNKDSHEKIITKTKSTTSTVSTSSATLLGFKCPLCQHKVISLRKHLIHYHKIGSSSSVVKQLESSLLNETTSSENEKITLTNKPHQDGYRIMDNEENPCKRPQVKRKKNYTLSHANARKKLKLNNKHNSIIQNASVLTQKQNLAYGPYKCDVCLGMYSSMHSFYKHKRIHNLRGETKENFHKFKCRYLNSPFNKKYKLLVEAKLSATSTNNVANNKINENDTLQLNNFKRNTLLSQTSKVDRATRYSERMRKNNETTCRCGRSFRNPHTLFVHKKNCELYQNEDTTTQNTRTSSDRDSGIGINITIKKRNDSYEIVGKDDEGKPQKFEISSLKEDILSHTSNHTKDFKASNTQQVPDTSESSKYSKNHSILKLEDTDEDTIIDIEDDIQIFRNEDNKMKQMVTQEDGKQNSSEQNDAKNEKTGRVTTLKQMCQEVLETRKSENVENKNKKYNPVKDQKTCKENNQIKNQEIHRENKWNLRSKRYRYSRVEVDHSYSEKVDTHFNPLTCGYCNEDLSTKKSYDNHQCTVEYGKSFDQFSLQLVCFCCKEVLNSYNEFDEHMKAKHFDCVYHCYLCPDRFKSDKARLYHFHSEHNDLVCKFCNKKIFISVKAFHEAYHLGFGYPCHKCKKAYISNSKLNYHKQTVHSNWADDLISCTICLKRVKLETFRSHMSMHKHNTCHFCGKIFADRVGIEYHTMMHHSTNAKLKCNICGTRFHTKKQLEVHEKVDGCNNAQTQNKKGSYNRKMY